MANLMGLTSWFVKKHMTIWRNSARIARDAGRLSQIEL